MNKLRNIGKDPNRTIISASTKLSDLINLNYNLLWTIDRIGLGFGFGDESIEEACRRNNINTNTLLLICNVYTFDGFLPSLDSLKKAELKDIVRYLHQSHAYYTNVAMVNLEEAINEMVKNYDQKLKTIIGQFFSGYKEELQKHFDYEETIVFPYVNEVLNHNGKDGYDIMQYEENHSDINEKLNDLKNIIMKYVPRQCNNQSICNVLFNLYRLDDDLKKHTSIEEDILIPIVNRLEFELRKQQEEK